MTYFFHLFLIALFLIIPITSESSITLSTSQKSGLIHLEWTDNANNEFVTQILRTLDSERKYEDIGSVFTDVTTFHDTPPTNGKYCYMVRALNVAGRSDPSNEACIEFTLRAPITPVLTILGHGKMKWMPIAGATGLHIARKISPNGGWGHWENVPASHLLYHDHKISSSTTYCYRAIAFNSVGDSDVSQEICTPPNS